MTQAGPRDVTSVLETRYWLTPAGWAATDPRPPSSPDDKDDQ